MNETCYFCSKLSLSVPKYYDTVSRYFKKQKFLCLYFVIRQDIRLVYEFCFL